VARRHRKRAVTLSPPCARPRPLGGPDRASRTSDTGTTGCGRAPRKGARARQVVRARDAARTRTAARQPRPDRGKQASMRGSGPYQAAARDASVTAPILKGRGLERASRTLCQERIT
jgi:hypothetical protein